jgi:hypothetical protein
MSTILSDNIAKEAYHAYGSVTNFKNYQGLPMPKWEDLTPTIRKAWVAASEKVWNLALGDPS